MTVDIWLRDLLAGLGCPAAEGEYTGADSSYFVYNISPITIFGDDKPALVRQLIQIHHYCPVTTNSRPLLRSVRKALLAAGCTWPDNPVGSVVEGKLRHTVLECELLTGPDDEVEA